MSTDFLDFEIDSMYFDSPLDQEVDSLINQASESYGTEKAELLLLRAYLMAPEHLSVLVALYRYYYYQHRLTDALIVADKAIKSAAKELHIGDNWKTVRPLEVAAGAFRSVGLVRFYLLALKAAGVVMVRLGDFDNGVEAMNKVLEHDPNDRLKTKELLEIVQSYSYTKENKNVLRFAC